MAKTHWYQGQNSNKFGCQHSGCIAPATVQWQRHATEAEAAAEQNLQGPYGAVVRNAQGPHAAAVFACTVHALPPAGQVLRHAADCPAPDPGCECA